MVGSEPAFSMSLVLQKIAVYYQRFPTAPGGY
jgi:hypothetical protein